MISEELLAEIKTNKGQSLLEISHEQAVLLVFLRHFGCVFCQEGINDIAQQKDSIRSKNVKIILVHMADNQSADDYFSQFALQGIDHISDPDTTLYTAFGLFKTNRSRLVGFKMLLKTTESVVVRGNWPSVKSIGDGFQMPGVFILEKGIIKESFIHNNIYDRPDYAKMVQCCMV